MDFFLKLFEAIVYLAETKEKMFNSKAIDFYT